MFGQSSLGVFISVQPVCNGQNIGGALMEAVYISEL